MTENKHGLVISTEATTCSPLQERLVAIQTLCSLKPKIVAADRDYHEGGFLEAKRELGIAPQLTRYEC